MKSFKFFPLLCILGSLLLSCDRDATTSVSDGSWTASFRVASSLTDSQLARATWVRVQASRSGVVVASDSAPYAAHSVTLTIPSAGAVDISLTGLNSNEDTVMWTGTGTIADGVANPGNVVTLVAGPGLQNSPTGTVAAPTFSVAGGTYTSAQTVTLASSTSGASIYYTTDGSAPTSSSTLYGGAIMVSASETIRAIAVKSGWTSSSVTSATYTITPATPAKPQYTLTVTQATGGTITLSPTGGRYDSGTTVIATATATSGYTFSGWTGASKSTISVCTFTVTTNLSLSASFTSSITPTPSTGDTGHFTDSRDGQAYKYVKIGTQTWMAQNLNYRNTSGKSDTVGVCYNGLSSNCTTYGRLYTWSEVMAGSSSSTSIPSGVQGICPSGWHVPSDAEWQTLEVSVGMSAATAATTGWRGTTEGTSLKANSSLWVRNPGTDAYGFSVLPAGFRDNDGTFNFLGVSAYFWSSSENDASYAWYRVFSYFYANVYRDSSGYKTDGFSLRCVQN